MNAKSSTLVTIPTTSKPSEVQRLAVLEELLELRRSTICVGGGSTVAGIDPAYNAFVRSPTGPVERHFGAASWRIDVSTPINVGESWQLGVFLAHALHAEAALFQSLAGQGDVEPDRLVWATGTVDTIALRIGSVGNVQRKAEILLEALKQTPLKTEALFFIPMENGSDISPSLFKELEDLGLAIHAIENVSAVVKILGLSEARVLANSKTPTSITASQGAIALLPIQRQRLPFQCDRILQRQNFKRVLAQAIDQPMLTPLHTVIWGPDEECGDMLVDVLYREELPRVLKNKRRKLAVEDFSLEWPYGSNDPTEGLDALRYQLHERLDFAWSADDNQLRQWLTSSNVTLVLRFVFDVHAWKARDHAVMTEWLRWWSNLEVGQNCPVLASIRLTSSPGVVKRLTLARRSRAVSETLSRISHNMGQASSFLHLDELQGVTFLDVEQWLCEAEALEGYDRDALRSKVRAGFEKHSPLSGAPMPMKMVASFLRDILDEHACVFVDSKNGVM